MRGQQSHPDRTGTKLWCLGLLLLLWCWPPSGLRADPSAQPTVPTSSAPPHEVFHTQTAKSYRDTGRAFLHDGKDDQAITNLTRAIRLNPTDAWAYQCRAIARGNKRDFAGAIADFRTALRISPDYANAYYNCGWFFQYQKHDLRVAIADYSEAIRLEPTNVDTLVARARAYEEQTNFDLALADFASAIQIAPTNAETFIDRAHAYLAQTNFDLALADFNTANQLQPNNPEWLIERAGAYCDHQAATQALADYAAAMQLNPTNDWTTFQCEAFALKMTNYPAAEMFYTQGTQSNPTNLFFWSALGEIHERMTNYDAAIADFTQCIQLSPTHAEYYANRASAQRSAAQSLANSGDQKKKQTYLNKALADWQQAAALDPQKLCRLGNFECHQGNYAAGIADFTHYLQNDPTNINALDLRAFAYEVAARNDGRRGDLAAQQHALASALADWNRLVAMKSAASNCFICFRGDFYARNQQYDRALGEYQQVLAQEPSNYQALISLGWFQATCPDPGFRNGREALTNILKVVDPGSSRDSDGLAALAAAYAETGDFTPAVHCQKLVLELITAEKRAAGVIADMADRLNLYEHHKPCQRPVGVLLFE